MATEVPSRGLRILSLGELGRPVRLSTTNENDVLKMVAV